MSRDERHRINKSCALSKAFLMGCDRNLFTLREILNQTACSEEMACHHSVSELGPLGNTRTHRHAQVCPHRDQVVL